MSRVGSRLEEVRRLKRRVGGDVLRIEQEAGTTYTIPRSVVVGKTY